jgi:uncharacterized protein DUF3810
MLRGLKILLILLAATIAATPLSRSTVERVYSRGIYAAIQPSLTRASNASRVAWFDVALLLVGAVILAVIIIRLRERHGWLLTFATIAFDTVAIAAVLYLWFLVAWGLNYQREALRSQLDFEESRITQKALRELAVRGIAFLNEHYEESHARGWADYEATSDSLVPAFVQAQRQLGMPWTAAAGRPKRSMMDLYFRRASVDGMTDPFFLETLTNQSLLPFERPFVVAHEWSHLAGYADESEANFVAWLICIRADIPEQYSAWLSLYGTIVNALAPADRAEVSQALEPGPRADLLAIADRVRRQISPLTSRGGYAVYDKFLKANRVQAGIRSYNEVIRLLVGTRFTEDGAPVLLNPTP